MGMFKRLVFWVQGLIWVYRIKRKFKGAGIDMININPVFFKKQKKVLRLLMDFNNGISEILYGGAAGGGKSRVGVSWIITMALMFPETRYLIGRAKLLALKQTTLKTFFDVCKDWGLKEGKHWKMNGQTNTITFFNGSEIILKDLFLYPSDPDFDSLGSLEITAAFIDEVPQVTEKAKGIVMSRIRYKLGAYCGHCGSPTKKSEVLSVDDNGVPDKWKCRKCKKETDGITPKILMSCNPSKNWVYNTFYKPFKDGKLAPYRAFVQSFVTDNKFISKHYRNNLSKLGELDRMRLRDGIWEYSDKLSMFMYDQLVEVMATKRVVEGERYFIAADIARLGKDKTVIVVLSSTMEVVRIVEIQHAELLAENPKHKPSKHDAKVIKQLQEEYEVDEYDIAIDNDGVGGGVVDEFENAEPIVNASTALNGENYANLKTQLYFRLAEAFNEAELAFNDITDEQAERLQEELQVLKRVKEEQDGKVYMINKADIKAMLGRSPDLSDSLAYAMFFFLEDMDDGYISF